MKTTELRIGNLVEFFVGAKPNDWQYNTIDYKDLEYISQYRPIPLTEEWLLKFGFEKVWHEFFLNGFCIFKDSDNFYYSLRDEGMMDVCIIYVHQLQNLYNALTGQELECSE